MLFVSNAFGDLGGHQGAFDEKRREFYFTGLDIYRWSNNKRKEFEFKWNTIYKHNIDKKEMSKFYDGECSLWDVQISTNNDQISALCALEDKPNNLIVFGREGEKVLVLSEDVHEYAWHPNGNQILYMTGVKKSRGDDIFIQSTGVWIYDIKREEKKKIVEKGWDLRIDSSNNVLYYWNGEKTVIYNLILKNTQETEFLKGIEYSPDGKYYADSYGSSWEEPYWSPFRIYDTKEENALSPERIGFISERDPVDYIWGKDGRIFIFWGFTSRTNYKMMSFIYDIESNLPIKKFEGRPVGINYDRSVLVVYREGEFFLEEIPEIKRSQ
jgi:WD40 repeat protein